MGEAQVLELVHEDVAVAGRQPRPDPRPGAHEAEGLEHEVAEVERPGLGQHAVVGGEEGRELALARRPRPLGLAVAWQRARPGACSRRPSTSSSLSRSIRWTMAPSSALGLPRRSCSASGSSSMRSSSIASRSAADTGATNGSRPASSASSASSRAQNSRSVVTAELLVGRGDAVLEAAAQVGRRRAEEVSSSSPSAGQPCSASQAKRSTSTVVLPVPAPASTSSGPPGWVTAARWAGVRDGAGTFVG